MAEDDKDDPRGEPLQASEMEDEDQRSADTVEHEQVSADTVQHDEEPAEQRTTQRDVVTHNPEGNADAPNAEREEGVPGSIYEQTKEGEQPYQWHTGTKRDHGSTDAIEFIDVKKSFGRATILNGLNPVSYTHLTLPTKRIV